MDNVRQMPEQPRPYVVIHGHERARYRSVAGRVVHLFAPWSAVPGAVVGLTVGRAGAVLLTPAFPPRRLPRWWSWRFHRLVLASQEEARAWACFEPLGRLVVVESARAPGEDPAEALARAAASAAEGAEGASAEALRVIYREAWSMAQRRRGGPPDS